MGRHKGTVAPSQDADSAAGRDVSLCLLLLLSALGGGVLGPNASFWICSWELGYFWSSCYLFYNGSSMQTAFVAKHVI